MEATAHSVQFLTPFSEELKNALLKKNKSSAKLQDSLRNKIFSGAKMKAEEIGHVIQHCQNPEDLLEICFISEQKADQEAPEQLWVAGLEKFGSSSLYLENLGFYFFQRRQYHKALNYLSKAHSLGKSFFAISVAIAAAYSVAQYHLVWDYFKMLDQKEQSRLDDNMLAKVATAALQHGQYKEAGKLFQYLQEKNRLPALPSLDEIMKEKFETPKEMKTWVEKTDSSMASKKERKSLSLNECITYATALMQLERYEDALKSMTVIKEERFS